MGGKESHSDRVVGTVGSGGLSRVEREPVSYSILLCGLVFELLLAFFVRSVSGTLELAPHDSFHS